MTQYGVKDTKPLDSMKLPLKKLDDQVIVLTGATSGIGLLTARMAAKRGAKLVLAARDEEALSKLAEELGTKEAQVVYLKTDVSKEEDVKKLAQKAREAFGGFDTWVNNASVSIYGHLTEVPIDEARKLFETNYWGVVYGSLEAVKHYQEKDEPGALINIASVAGHHAFPIMGTYSSSKYAVRGFTDGLRMDVEKQQIPAVVTQIHPARVNTPYPDNAASYIDKAPTHDAMMYPPESVAESILYAAEHPVRDMFVGGQSKMVALMGAVMPRVTDRYMEKVEYNHNYDDARVAAPPEESTLHGNGTELQERGTNTGWIRKKSWMVEAKTHPNVTKGILAGAGVLAAGALLWKKYNSLSNYDRVKGKLKAKTAGKMLKHPKTSAKILKKFL